MRVPAPKQNILIAGCTLAFLFADTSTQAQSVGRCTDLTKVKVEAAEIGLPSGVATITSAQIQSVAANSKIPGGTREFCKVLGTIAPIDSNAPPVNFQVNLPLQWNGKA